MFKRICIAPEHPRGTHFDLGLVGEALVFYGEVILIVQYSSLKGLLEQCNPETLLRYLQHGRLKIFYRDNVLGAISRNENTSVGRYDFGLISSAKQSLENAAIDLFVEATGKSGLGRRMAAKFLRFAELISYDIGITSQIVEEVQKGDYISEYVSRRLGRSLSKELAGGVMFQFGNVIAGEGFPLSTNINFSKSNDLQLIDEGLRKPSSILANYGTTVADLSLWSKLDAEVAVNDNQADILRARFDILLNQRRDSDKIISTFQDLVYDDARAIRHAINSGIRNLDDLYPIVEASSDFSHWLQQQEPKGELIKAYYRKVVSDSWIEKLPVKTTRWAIFTGAGLAMDLFGAGGLGTGAGIALSVLDSFLVEKILKGWKPNQFIHGELQHFIAPSNSEK